MACVLESLLLIYFTTETSFQSDFPVPPPYSVATSLPTYDEAEKAKAAALAATTVEVISRVRIHFSAYFLSTNVSLHLLLCFSHNYLCMNHHQEDEFLPRDDFNDADQLRVGNDGIFMLAFFSK